MGGHTFSREEIEYFSKIDKDGYINCPECAARRTVDNKYIVHACPQCKNAEYRLVPEERLWEAVNAVTINDMKSYFQSLVASGASPDEIKAKADDLAEGIRLAAQYSEDPEP